ncbi:energy transducer TonB [Burkholderiaceae bacterium UC74_6]
MNFAQENNGSGRVVGFGIVVLIHIVLAWAIASGLAKKIVAKIAEPIEAKVVEEVKPPPPPPEKVLPPPPDIKAPPPPFVPVPEVVVTAPAPPTQAVTTSVPPPVNTVAAAPAPVVQAPPAPPAKATVSSTCSKWERPEMPSLNWSGEATFMATIAVRGNKIASIDVATVRGGGIDRKSERAIKNAITQTVQSTYVCSGENVVFQQEFAFRNE